MKQQQTSELLEPLSTKRFICMLNGVFPEYLGGLAFSGVFVPASLSATFLFD
jgi:hypothetical protein